MLKCDIDSTPLNFDDLEIGDTFRIKDYGYEWYGMKVYYDMDITPIYYIMDISDEIGKLYEYHKDYHIIDIVDLKIVGDEGR